MASSSSRSGCNEEDIALLKVMFRKIDTDKSGSIERQELSNLAASLGYPMNAQQLQQAFKELDSDNSGTISFDEFSTWWFSGERGSGSSYTLNLLKLKLQLLSLEGKATSAFDKLKTLSAQGDLRDFINVEFDVNIGKELGDEAASISVQAGKVSEQILADIKAAAGVSDETSFGHIDFPLRAGASMEKVEEFIAFGNDVITVITSKAIPQNLVKITLTLVQEDGNKILRLAFVSKSGLNALIQASGFLGVALDSWIPNIDFTIKMDSINGLGPDQEPSAFFATAVGKLVSNLSISTRIMIHRAFGSVLSHSIKPQAAETIKTLTTIFTAGQAKLSFASLPTILGLFTGPDASILQATVGDLTARFTEKFWDGAPHQPAEVVENIFRIGELFNGPSTIRAVLLNKAYVSLNIKGISLTNLIPRRRPGEAVGRDAGIISEMAASIRGESSVKSTTDDDDHYRQAVREAEYSLK